MLHQVDHTPVELFDGFEFLPRLDDACQYSTMFRAGKPVATLCRKSAADFNPNTPVWGLYATDGTLLRKWRFVPRSYDAIARGASFAVSKFLGE